MKHLLPQFFVVCLMTVSVWADEPLEKIKLPARETYREPYETWNEGMPGQHVKVTVTPATFPYPLLKYRLNSYSTELEPSNAAPLYALAYTELIATQRNCLEDVYRSKEYVELKSKELNATDKDNNSSLPVEQLKFKAFPIPQFWTKENHTDITADEEKKLYSSLGRVFDILEKASKQSHCDWAYRIKYRGIATMLPHLDETRTLGRFLQGKANWEIRNGKYEDAVKTIRVGIALGNHVEKDMFLVSSLVGIAIHGMMVAEIRTLECQPDAPNFYPALTQIILPADALQYSLQGEQMFLFSKQNAQNYFDHLDTMTDEECQAVYADLLSSLIEINSIPSNAEKQNFFIKPFVYVLCYPYARERLLKKGVSDEEIEKMSVHMVVVPYLLEEIKAAYDTLHVLATLPRGSSHDAIVFDDSIYSNPSGSPVNIFLALFLPALDGAKTAFNRNQQSYELLKITEAIRFYAAAHDGKLPESLDAIKDVPVMTIDPVSGKPFGYKLEGNTVIISYETHNKSQIEITVDQMKNER